MQVLWSANQFIKWRVVFFQNWKKNYFGFCLFIALKCRIYINCGFVDIYFMPRGLIFWLICIYDELSDLYVDQEGSIKNREVNKENIAGWGQQRASGKGILSLSVAYRCPPCSGWTNVLLKLCLINEIWLDLFNQYFLFKGKFLEFYTLGLKNFFFSSHCLHKSISWISILIWMEFNHFLLKLM